MNLWKNASFVSAIACFAATAAIAQSGATGDDTNSADKERHAPSADQGDDVKLEEIVVTANHRTEKLEKAPAAITAVSGATLVTQGVTDLQGMSVLVPSARFATSTSDVIQVNIRGIGQTIDSPYISEPVVTNVDEIYVPRLATGFPLYDVGQVEVLPGPQGALYGKGAIGGVVNINSNLPKPSFGVSLTAEGASYGDRRATAVLNAPLAADLAVRIAGYFNDRDAYLSNGTDTDHARAVRLSALYDPGTSISVLLWADYWSNTFKPESTVYFAPFLNSKPYDQPTIDPAGVPGFSSLSTHADPQSYAFGGKVTGNIGDTVITYIPSYRDYRSFAYAQVVGLPADVDVKVRQLTQELRSDGELGHGLSWSGDLYYYHNDTSYNDPVGPPLLPPLAGGDLTTINEGRSGMLQLGYKLSDATRLTGSGRYSHDSMTPHDAMAYLVSLSEPYPHATLRSWNHLDWKVAIDADIGPASLAYANVQTGYAPGGYLDGPLKGGLPLPAQRMLGYTAGTKIRLAGGAFQVNDEVFYYDYRDYQVTVQEGALPYTTAVPKTRSYGNELKLTYAPEPATQLNAAITLVSAKIVELEAGGANYAGNHLPNAPTTTVTAGLRHVFNVPSSGEVTLDVATNYDSGYWGDYTNIPGVRQKAFTKTDLSLTYSPVHDNARWDVSLFVHNVENSAVLGSLGNSGYPAPYAHIGYLEPPRTWGARLRVELGHL